jgi:hypothetical protein
MKDYNCTFGQFLKFVTFVEGNDIVEDNTIWISKIRLQNFIKMMKISGKAPNTIANKAKMFCEVSLFIFYFLIIIVIKMDKV